MLITFSFILARLYPPRKTFAAHITISFGYVRKLTFGKAANQKVHSCAGAFLLFATSGGSGVGDTDKFLHPSCSEQTAWRPAKRFAGSTGAAELQKWVEGLKL